jgi:hypothetical protein
MVLGPHGRLKITPLWIELKHLGKTVYSRQYPIPLEGRRGLQPVIKGLIKDGLLESVHHHITPQSSQLRNLMGDTD